MKKRITLGLYFIVFVMSFVLLVCSCKQSTSNHVLFEFPKEGGVKNYLLDQKTDEELKDLFPQKQRIEEKLTDDELRLNDICSFIDKSVILKYSESYYDCGRNLIRRYESKGIGECDYNNQDKAILFYLDLQTIDAQKQVYSELSEDELLSKEECSEIAKKIFRELYSNDNYFVLSDDVKEFTEKRISNFYKVYKFVFRRIANDVIVSEVEIQIRNNGDLELIKNSSYFENKIFDKIGRPELSDELEDIDSAIKEKINPIPENCTLEFQRARIKLAKNNKLYVSARYALTDKDGFSSLIFGFAEVK